MIPHRGPRYVPTAPARPQSAALPLRLDRAALCRDSATVACAVWPELPRGPLRYQISRARSGNPVGPVYGVAQWLYELRRTGAPRERAELLIAHARVLVEALWCDRPEDWPAASMAETEAQAAANVAQQRAAHDPAALPLFAEREELLVARAIVAAAEARREYARTRTRSAA